MSKSIKGVHASSITVDDPMNVAMDRSDAPMSPITAKRKAQEQEATERKLRRKEIRDSRIDYIAGGIVYVHRCKCGVDHHSQEQDPPCPGCGTVPSAKPESSCDLCWATTAGVRVLDVRFMRTSPLDSRLRPTRMCTSCEPLGFQERVKRWIPDWTPGIDCSHEVLDRLEELEEKLEAQAPKHTAAMERFIVDVAALARRLFEARLHHTVEKHSEGQLAKRKRVVDHLWRAREHQEAVRDCIGIACRILQGESAIASPIAEEMRRYESPPADEVAPCKLAEQIVGVDQGAPGGDVTALTTIDTIEGRVFHIEQKLHRMDPDHIAKVFKANMEAIRKGPKR